MALSPPEHETPLSLSNLDQGFFMDSISDFLDAVQRFPSSEVVFTKSSPVIQRVSTRNSVEHIPVGQRERELYCVRYSYALQVLG